MSWSTRPDLTPAQQFLFLRANPICEGDGALNAKGLTWEYHVRPTPLSREYRVRLSYERGGSAKAVVLEPDIQLLAGERKLPHVYRDPLRLCLHLPKAHEWVGSMRLDQTFIPWIATWLFYFEEWLGSDEWKGGGEHPDPDSSEVIRRAVRRATR